MESFLIGCLEVFYQFKREKGNVMDGFGALPDTMMRDLIAKGCITGAQESHVNPASIDLAVTDAFRLESAVLPKKGQSIAELFHFSRAEPFPMPWGIFEPGVAYCFRVSASFDLPFGYYAHFNPKSSSGRDAWLIRVIIDGVDVYDALPRSSGKQSPWLLARPTKMPIKMSPGETLAQARIFNWDTRLTTRELQHVHSTEGEPLLLRDGVPIQWDQISHFSDYGALGVRLYLKPGKQIGWRCRENRRIVDYSVLQDRNLYFEPVYADENGGVLLEEGYFYILATMEEVRVPPWLACEVVPAHSWLGEVRIHAAGYIDPGWGYGHDGSGRGRHITLEVWPQENIYVQSGQLIGLLRFEKMIKPPMIHYDQKETSHYIGQQGALPSKRFK